MSGLCLASWENVLHRENRDQEKTIRKTTARTITKTRMKMTSSSRIPLALIMVATFGWIVHIENVHCQSLGTSYQQNHPNHVLSTMGLRKPTETMEPSLATPQTGKP